MSGHSKWANIKHRKAAQDAKRGNLFQKLVRAIIIAAKDGGGDPAMNMRLKTAIERAKAVSVPNDNITRAIKRGTGELGDITYDELTYEVIGPSGIAILVNVMTDNRNRTTPEIRALLARNGGQMGSEGSVAWMFDRKGVIDVKGEGLDEDSLMTLGLDSGMSDMEESDEGFTLYCEPSDLDTLQKALEDNKYVVDNAEVSMIAKTPVEISDAEAARKVMRLVDALEEHDDVQNVYTNFEIADSIASQLEDE
ncbi:MAG: YebC/PmpR family DNA-binding transcriptional regulator [Synergistaceae bacterium]|nr:YebC/PmpR family DNA-binding transcriptional regulator [Synergistaceae bacterium]MBQ3448613.1 YebC/PmpR family DNA-binding transcriptional regulator [Synergistaceae bacterium]MBQ3693746.1 YebC/PmpR family DNA-binding transcriptional regulator [Synergistaceae bacterium]MBQ9628791.1 YebC/PmpR family DNA-binding transcriptional regulator [Synergistaceae bacterium]MBR0250650.1 YebC/PmpR family DNA-binding transcriptional regulator [Synergistaceae bacterium]